MKSKKYLKSSFSLTKSLLVLSVFALFSCNGSKNAFDASGVFEATEIIVSAEASGKILKFDVEEGQQLEANQTVGFIDSLQLYLRKKQLLTNVKTVEDRRPDINKQIAATEQQIATANTEKKRIENLLKGNAATQKQLDDINAQIALLEKQLAAQKSTLEISSQGVNNEAAGLDIQIEQLNDQLQKCKIQNSIKGTVLVKYAQANEITAQGKALYKIADTENMILRAYIVSSQLSQLKIGQNVKVFIDYGEKEKKEYQGKIEWISTKAEFTPKTILTKDERANLVYAVKIAVKNDGLLKIGMYGEIKIGN